MPRTGHLYDVVKEVQKPTPGKSSQPYEITLEGLTFELPSTVTVASHIEPGDRFLIDFEPSQPQLGYLVSWWKNDSYQGELRIAEGNIVS